MLRKRSNLPRLHFNIKACITSSIYIKNRRIGQNTEISQELFKRERRNKEKFLNFQGKDTRSVGID